MKRDLVTGGSKPRVSAWARLPDRRCSGKNALLAAANLSRGMGATQVSIFGSAAKGRLR